MIRLPRLVLMLAGAAAVSAGGYAYMAGNTVSASNVGEGSNTVSGYVVSNIDYSGVADVGNPTGATGTMTYYNPSPLDVNGISEQDGVSTVSFTLSPDNAHWAAVQLYNSNKQIIGGGGASNCIEDSTSHVWTCQVSGPSGPVNAEDIAWIDVEAAQ